MMSGSACPTPLNVSRPLSIPHPFFFKRQWRRHWVESEHLNAQISSQKTEWLTLKATFDFSPGPFTLLRVGENQTSWLLVGSVLRKIITFFNLPKFVSDVDLHFFWSLNLILDLDKMLLVIDLVVTITESLDAGVWTPTVREYGRCTSNPLFNDWQEGL